MKELRRATYIICLFLLTGSFALSGQEAGGHSVTGLRRVDTIRTLPVYDLDSLFPHLSDDRLAALRGEGKISTFNPDGYRVDLGPRVWTVREVERSLEELDPAFSLESVYLIPIQEEIRSAERPELFIYNVLRSISTMEGIEYYSHTRERWRTLFHESRVINNPDDAEEIPDPRVTSIPGLDEIYAFQHDSSFGRNTYLVTYRYGEGTYYLRLMNLSPVRYLGIIPVVSREDMHVYVSVIPTDEGLIFYGHAAVDVLTTLGMEDRLRRSFENRVEAIFSWFQNQVEETPEPGS